MVFDIVATAVVVHGHMAIEVRVQQKGRYTKVEVVAMIPVPSKTAAAAAVRMARMALGNQEQMAAEQITNSALEATGSAGEKMNKVKTQLRLRLLFFRWKRNSAQEKVLSCHTPRQYNRYN